MNAIIFGLYDFNSKVKKEFNEKNESFIRNCIYFIIIKAENKLKQQEKG